MRDVYINCLTHNDTFILKALFFFQQNQIKHRCEWNIFMHIHQVKHLEHFPLKRKSFLHLSIFFIDLLDLQANVSI